MTPTIAPIKLSPFHAVTQHLGAQFIERDGWRIPASYAVTDGLTAARERAALSDETSSGRITLEGEEADRIVRDAFNVPALTVGSGAAYDAGYVYRLRPEQYLAGTRRDRTDAEFRRLRELARAASPLVTVTDMSHGLAELALTGPAAQELLSQVCAIDLNLLAFPNLAARQTIVAKIKQLVIRRDRGRVPSFTVIGARSLGAYLWETLMNAGRELAIAPIGLTDLELLERE